ncbi:MAG: tRNA uridine-5-carboxymethylaminomethyl(34) synthesis GTPase MnmE [Hyphomicrobiales bacterium]|nr:MAG: tRNA uridine-5-carboxymethylaminomethyl(34) synthesis GTPase MnmE [Hyphomicrobiales bacterium]
MEGKVSAGKKSADTIFALSSGAVPAAIAIVRLTGPAVRFALETIAGSLPSPRVATLAKLRHPRDGSVLDEAVVLFFPGPASVTGEDVGELHLHGGRAVVAGVLAALEELTGLRAAEAGEFTRRGFENGRLDLTGIEGLADLLQAETDAQRRQALRQYGGEARAIYDEWRRRIIAMRAEIEANLDFADEEDVPDDIGEDVGAKAAALADEIDRHLADGRRGERLRLGVEVAVMGPPNAGKSSLLNALAHRDVAIVTEEAGTTRDVIEVAMDLGGFPVTIADTAGVRDTEGRVEKEGIRRALARGREADLVLWVWDGSGPMPEVPADISASGATIWLVRNKVDLIDSDAEQTTSDVFDLSVSEGTGLGALTDALEGFASDACGRGESVLITRARHRENLVACRDGLRRVSVAESGMLEVTAEELRSAGDAIGRIAGKIGVEDLLDVVFSEFCIGK